MRNPLLRCSSYEPSPPVPSSSVPSAHPSRSSKDSSAMPCAAAASSSARASSSLRCSCSLPALKESTTTPRRVRSLPRIKIEPIAASFPHPFPAANAATPTLPLPTVRERLKSVVTSLALSTGSDACCLSHLVSASAAAHIQAGTNGTAVTAPTARASAEAPSPRRKPQHGAPSRSRPRCISHLLRLAAAGGTHSKGSHWQPGTGALSLPLSRCTAHCPCSRMCRTWDAADV
mmetsp:Transcript_21879/g.50306  ORF Transcript_21879/g.50306 Transcript_21879/m.50306 type:complete len:232 (+) Transcript_21879:1209-1904(+)